ncbi:hypothetical protein N8J89_18850 [Crossiella sp. CA-258035]|uniref:hypothetical protein n=1 Tax=Crossiella sp. CA-258035 TaxID=2981138 RepID=UPI0024BC6891|nr:hypothetical protein [Crossiella sp. CA-258035]WHT23049.1 hypothetical protein N8J89_18850 [Crossiella sp. CA-258035]
MHVLAATLECDGLAVHHTDPEAEVPVLDLRPPTAEVRRRDGDPVAGLEAVLVTTLASGRPARSRPGSRPGRADSLGYQVEPPGPG